MSTSSEHVELQNLNDQPGSGDMGQNTPSVTEASRVGALGNLVAGSDAIQKQYEKEVENRTESYTGLKNKGRTASKAAIGEFADIKATSRKQGALRREMSQAAIKAGDVKEVADKERDLKGGETIYEHVMSIPDVCKMYKTDTTKGIDSMDRVKEMQALFGYNALTPPKVTPWYCKLFAHMVGGFSLLLWGGSILCFFVFFLDGSKDNLYLGIVLGAVVFLTGVFSWYQEMKSDAAMSAFKNMVPSAARCLRANFSTNQDYEDGFDATELVRGDVVKIKSGDRIPADCIIFSQSDMKVDQAALTGEPLPLPRDIKCTNEQPHETKNLCFYGTFCTQGECRGIVLRTGDETMVGQIAKQTMEGVPPKTTMEIEIEHFIHIVSGVAAVIGVTFFIIALVNGYSFLESVIFMIGIIVANVPEGLLATVTVALTLTAETMAQVSVLVKDNKTIETLGSITCIASDKTGTLTMNRMTATHAIYGNRIVTLDSNLEDDNAVYKEGEHYFEELRRISCLCGTATFIEQEKVGSKEAGTEKTLFHFDPQNKLWAKPVLSRVTDGDASESAILKFNEPLMEKWYEGCTHQADGNVAQFVAEYRKQHPLIGGVPFNSSNKWMCTLHKATDADLNFPEDKGSPTTEKVEDDDDMLVMVKGAPERIMSMANYILVDPDNQDEKQKASAIMNESTGQKDLVPWDDIEANKVGKLQMTLAAAGERVLGFGYCKLKAGQSQLRAAGCKKNVDTGVFEIDAQQMTAMPSTKPGGFPDGGYLWAKSGTSWTPPADADDNVKPWTVPEGNTGMIFVGMMSLVDPPRPEVPAAIAECHTAGIKVVMVTGDHPVTAKAISERIGILQPGSTIESWVVEQIERDNIQDLKAYMWDQEWDPETQKEVPNTGFQLKIGDTYKTWDKITEIDAVNEFKAREGRDVASKAEVARFGKLSNPEDKPLAYGKSALWELNDGGRGDHVVRGQVPLENEDGTFSSRTTEGDIIRRTAFKDPVAKWWRGFKFHDKDGRPHPGDPVQGLVVAGPQLDEFTEADWRYALSRPQLTFARTLPDQKQDIVAHMQDHHESMASIGEFGVKPQVVAVTGDGVNDSPALKKADCGVAMGTGSEVAQEAANMILMNDDFASIVEGIRQGRLIFDNLKKSIAYTLTSNIPEITPFLALILLKIPIPLETVMILCIDLGTDMLPAISLAYEEPESDIMLRMPRNKEKDHLVNNKLIGLTYGMIGMIQAAAGFTSYFSVFAYYRIGYSDLAGIGFDYTDEDKKFVCGLDHSTRMGHLRQAQTAFLMSIIIVQWTDVMICKTRTLSILEQGMSNFTLNVGLLEETLLGLALSYVPFCNDAFKTAPLDSFMWFYAIPFAILILVFDEIRKMLMRLEREKEAQKVEGKDQAPAVGFIEACTYY